MSALPPATDDTVVDHGHLLTRLVNRVQPHLSHLVDNPTPRPVIDIYGNRTLAICAPLNRTFVMTTRGLARIVRPFLFRSTPFLMSHVSIAMIELSQRRQISNALQDLLDEHERVFG